MIKTICTQVIVFAFCWNVSFGQNDDFIQFQVKDGLPSSEVYEVFEDDFGYLWFLTDNGIARYDGYDFEIFNSLDGLTDDIFFKHFKKDDGTICLYGQNNTISQINGLKPDFSEYKYNDSLQKYANGIVKSFGLDEENQLFVSFGSGLGYLHIDKEGHLISESRTDEFVSANYTVIHKKHKWLHYVINDDTPCASEHISSAYHRKDTKSSAAFMVSKTHAFFSLSPELIELRSGKEVLWQLPRENVLDSKLLTEGVLWISQVGKGITFFNLEGEQTANYLYGMTVTNAFEDSEGNVWFSTLNNGVFVKKNVLSWVATDTELNHHVYSISHTNENRIVVAYFNGNLCELQDRRLVQLHKSKSGKQSIVRYLPARGGLHWMMDGDLKNYKTNHSLPEDFDSNPTKMVLLRHNRLGFCGYFGFNYYTPDQIKIQGAAPSRVYDFTEFDGKIYLASYSGIYRSTNEDWTEFEAVEGLSERSNHLAVIDDQLLVATQRNGILVYKDGIITHQIPASIFGNSLIECMTYDTVYRQLWIGTTNELHALDCSTPHTSIQDLTNFSSLIPNQEITTLFPFNDTLWIGTKRGLCYLSTQQIEQKQRVHEYDLKLKSIQINDVLVTAENLKDLSYQENRIDFNFGAIRLTPGEPLRYRYKLLGAEEHWNYTTSRRVLYPNLREGVYTFIVQVANSSGAFGTSQLETTFTIHPPYWQTSWFFLSCVGLFILITYLFFRFRILLYNRDLIRESIRWLLRRLKTDEHFIILNSGGKEVKVYTRDILFVKSEGNYIEVHTQESKVFCRGKIGEFIDSVPDPLEFIRIRRSHIVRIDKVTAKGKKEIYINDFKFVVGETYLGQLDKIVLD